MEWKRELTYGEKIQKFCEILSDIRDFTEKFVWLYKLRNLNIGIEIN